jgi:hypothetical protein
LQKNNQQNYQETPMHYVFTTTYMGEYYPNIDLIEQIAKMRPHARRRRVKKQRLPQHLLTG